MTDLDLAYLAGVVDSDGSIGVVARLYRKSGRTYFTPRVTVKQVTPQAVALAELVLGGHTFYEKAQFEERRRLYRWEVSAEAAYHALMALRPFLRIKRPQAENCIALVEARGLRERSGVPRGRPILSLADEARLRTYYERARALNRGHVGSS